jgi:hypothetical protein
VLATADVFFIATPHKAYRELAFPAGKKVFDVWGISRKK